MDNTFIDTYFTTLKDSQQSLIEKLQKQREDLDNDNEQLQGLLIEQKQALESEFQKHKDRKQKLEQDLREMALTLQNLNHKRTETHQDLALQEKEI